MDQKVGYDLLQNLGLAGGFGARLMLLGAMLLHGVLLVPRALHDSSWGRWVKRMVFEVLFLVVFQVRMTVTMALSLQRCRATNVIALATQANTRSGYHTMCIDYTISTTQKVHVTSGYEACHHAVCYVTAHVPTSLHHVG
jgi:hypothetical protein